MKKYKVEITSSAFRDINLIYEYIKYDLMLSEYADRLIERIFQNINSLEYYPKKYSKIDIQSEKLLDIRRVIVDKYLILYVVEPNRVIVTDIVYGASNFDKHLNIKK